MNDQIIRWNSHAHRAAFTKRSHWAPGQTAFAIALRNAWGLNALTIKAVRSRGKESAWLGYGQQLRLDAETALRLSASSWSAARHSQPRPEAMS